MSDRIAQLEQQVLEALPKGLFIGGEWIETSSTIPVENPAKGAPFAEIADATPEQAVLALDAACDAAASWAATKPRERAELLRRVFDLINERKDIFAALMTMEMGKTFNEALGEVAYGNEYVRWFSEQTCRIAGYNSIAPASGKRILTEKVPVGPVLAITPWNFPLAMATRKIAPALAAGCTVVVKPAKLTPLTTLLFGKILQEAGLPAGVVNIITTNRSGATTGPLISDPRMRKITFTGSTEVGVGLLRQAAGRVLRTSMELGGNAPVVVLADADLDVAVQGAMDAKMRNLGEACTAGNRFIVHESIADEFTKRFTERMAAQTVGYGLDPATNVGPLIDNDQRSKVLELIQDAVDKGGKITTGGNRLDRPGYFMQPTVVSDIQPGARVLTEEIFGPFAPIITFSTEQEAIDIANGTDFGLAAYVFSNDLRTAMRVGDGIETGMVGINTGVVSDAAAPFGGVKMSGLGREGSELGIEEYLETKYYALPL
ncbi:Succinate-semialdehyde dehydrogenase [bioreactor metagenome]|jgi:succinate-semialdehyde dehydrogenase/glutarate-semialdehyde dehydrogenase|uniref:NAD-dependent succinate-semialdehyde dehydrogenase n=2 Tax=root TaxID=1 RepID=A0AAN0KA17_9ACTN|nr:NAD-dependent succinate-semialdehyde dehydrogenase [Brooklawnia sp. SH051]MCB0883423.1 NAD-dependent succinate-semialdehyde dehydrogenase [Propionibacteriaceae bacterium]MEA5121638.1 NAD-dependent succinate-semialdehyde dehydrogenase [Propionibacterium sp.]NLI84746.1 NAD-dependent succinate-semialdehyde dehydrogenase [Propionibacterium sp.]BEH00935.1 NAD-dependent succinate-semialdehyde dehydrogenase [Brooklawnia sp. SH051]